MITNNYYLVSYMTHLLNKAQNNSGHYVTALKPEHLIVSTTAGHTLPIFEYSKVKYPDISVDWQDRHYYGPEIEKIYDSGQLPKIEYLFEFMEIHYNSFDLFCAWTNTFIETEQQGMRSYFMSEFLKRIRFLKTFNDFQIREYITLLLDFISLIQSSDGYKINGYKMGDYIEPNQYLGLKATLHDLC